MVLLTLPIAFSTWLNSQNVFTDKREVKMLRIIEPKDKKKDFIAGPAQFGPDLGGETQYQVQWYHMTYYACHMMYCLL